MGGAASATNTEGTVEDVTKRILQSCDYYINDNTLITNNEIELARSAWQIIVEDRSPVYLEQRNTEGFDSTSCLSWFYDSFFRISNENDHLSKELYKV